MTERGPSLMMIPGEYQPRRRAPFAELGETLDIRYEHPSGSVGTDVPAPPAVPLEWPLWARVGVPLAALFLVMFVAMWITSLTR